jgi:hypothetical protein
MCVIKPELYFPSSHIVDLVPLPHSKTFPKNRVWPRTRTSAIPKWCENIIEIVCRDTAFIKLYATGNRGKSPRNKYATKNQQGYPLCHAHVKVWIALNQPSVVLTIFLGGTGKFYKSTLDILMSYIKRQDFARDYVYSDVELCAITPKHILEWMNVKTFGTPNLR